MFSLSVSPTSVIRRHSFVLATRIKQYESIPEVSCWQVRRTITSGTSLSQADNVTELEGEDIPEVETVQRESAKKQWENLGLRTPLVEGLRSAYPDVVAPTAAQEKFIPAILEGRDVLLKDDTGTGKSFGIALALLGKPRVKYIRKILGERQDEDSITSLVLVPHYNLAYQYLNWIQRIASASSSASATTDLEMDRIVQFITRVDQQHLTSGLIKLHKTKPHILVSTPQAILDLHKHDPDLLPLQYLSTVVVDEVDYLIETVPKKDPERSFKKAYTKAMKKIRKHPGHTRELLDIIYSGRMEVNKRQAEGVEEYRKGSFVGGMPGPQLVLSSATLRTHLNNYLFDESGWLNRGFFAKVKNTGSRPMSKEGINERAEAAAVREAALTGRVKHSIIEVSDAEIRNVKGTVRVTEERRATDEEVPLEAAEANAEENRQYAQTVAEIQDEYIEKFQSTPSPFNPNALEAIATAVALDVPRLALLVIPSSASVYRCVYDLRELGLDARVYDPRKPGVGSGDERNPVLLVTTLAVVRGLDLPELTHVFSLGIPDGPRLSGRAVDAYLHVAGRAGRFGRPGKVVTVVTAEEDPEKDEAKVSEGEWMRRILREIGVAPVHFGHFP